MMSLSLQEKGVIQKYYNKWWKIHGHHSESVCKTKKKLDQMAMANALSVVNIGGIFVVLLCGLAFAVMVAIVEFCWSNQARDLVLVSSAQFLCNVFQEGTGDTNRAVGRSLCAEMVRTLLPFLFRQREQVLKIKEICNFDRILVTNLPCCCHASALFYALLPTQVSLLSPGSESREQIYATTFPAQTFRTQRNH